MSLDLPALLTPKPSGTGRWIGSPGPAMGPRLFGGQAVAQALMAASAQESGGKLAHSLHCYFLKAGIADEPVIYDVTTLSEGRSFASRRIEATQSDQVIFTMVASFHTPEPGFSHQEAAPLPLDFEAAQASLKAWVAKHEQVANSPLISRLQNRPVEVIPLDPGSLFGGRAREPHTGSWVRMRDAANAGPHMQRALLAYASDMMLLRNAMLPHGVRPGTDQMQVASLDHAVWFHETPDFDQWHLYATGSTWAGHARGMNHGTLFDQQGRMIATVQQESLMRPRGETLERLQESETA